ncbi:hypothetical protein [Nitrosomonas communis]|uniref:Uncharacterized protein n=1 Tax=Nitrosomonas communis TaxID=44574 RepID=A0A1I4QRZ9_9PROT|nr:hypothetical protein [Nitrosomonas communis]SFM42852.1 hypothetical protein SAMN05421863_102829 [Nitrosomonas communis]
MTHTIPQKKTVVVPFKPQTKISLADFPIGSPEFELLKKRFKHSKTAQALQHLEFLYRQYEMPVNGIYRNIYPCGDMPINKTISGHIGIKSRRIVFSILNEIRQSYQFEKAVKLIPNEIDFRGKLYASFYLPSDPHRTVYWFRNQKLINELCAEIEQELANLKHAKEACYVIPQKPACEPQCNTASELSCIPSGTPSYTNIENLEKRKKKNNDKGVTDPPFLRDSNPSFLRDSNAKAGENYKTKVSSKDSNVNVSTDKNVYSLYKSYCESLDKGILLPPSPTNLDAKKLGKFFHVFIGLGLKREELPQFFKALGANHEAVVEYLKERGVWQVKDYAISLDSSFLAGHANRIISWYAKQENQLLNKASLKSKRFELSLEVTKPKAPFITNSKGFTYQEKQKLIPEEERESLEYAYVYFEKEDPQLAEVIYSALKNNSIDLDASEERMNKLRALSLDEFDKLATPR